MQYLRQGDRGDLLQNTRSDVGPVIRLALSQPRLRKENTMIEIGIFHNGASDLKAVTTSAGVVVNDGSLEEVHQSYQRVLIGQIRQGILADRSGLTTGS